MRYFAKISPQGAVLQVSVTNDDGFIPDLHESHTYVETWMSGGARKNFAARGHKFDRRRGGFIPAKPFPSWVLNEKTLRWESPVGPPPNVGGPYRWRESIKAWAPR